MMNNPTDTNQASEDELRQSLATLFYDDSYEYMLSEQDLFDVGAIDAVIDIIRNEKLKLLAEVREQAGEYELNIHGFYDKDVSDKITAVPLEALNKLEAEL